MASTPTPTPFEQELRMKKKSIFERGLQESSLGGYITRASTLVETNPALLCSQLGLGRPKLKKNRSIFSGSQIIEDYQGMNEEEEEEEEESTDISPSNETLWWVDLIQTLSGWLYSNQASKDLSQEDLSTSTFGVASPLSDSFWAEWEWVLSRTEELAIQQSEAQSKKIQEELQSLRRTARHLQQRPFFVSKTQELLTFGNPSCTFKKEQLQVLCGSPLSASLRSKLLRDIIDQFSPVWLTFIGASFFADKKEIFEAFADNYEEKDYSKNVTGALVSMGFMASHGHDEMLTPQVLGDILWSWWSTMCRSIREIGEIDLSQRSEAVSLLAEQILQSGSVITSMWYETLKNSQGSSTKTGVLPQQWKQLANAEEVRLNHLREVGLVDAKFRDGPTPSTRKSTMTPDRLASVKAKLEERFYCSE